MLGCSTNATRPPVSLQSAKLRTAETFAFTYGRVEISARLPRGDWMWPALWLLPANSACEEEEEEQWLALLWGGGGAVACPAWLDRRPHKSPSSSSPLLSLPRTDGTWPVSGEIDIMVRGTAEIPLFGYSGERTGGTVS